MWFPVLFPHARIQPHYKKCSRSAPASADGRPLGDSVGNCKAINMHNVLTSSAAYHIYGQVFTTQTSFLLDTGASVSLLRKDIWDHATSTTPGPILEPWTGQKLVSVDGSPLTAWTCHGPSLFGHMHIPHTSHSRRRADH